MTPLIIGLIIAYLIGSIPTALIAGYIIAGIDIRATGSGNAGATNVYRVFGTKPYVVVLAIDIVKGYGAARWIAVFIGTGSLNPLQASILFGLAAVFGHIFTVFGGFRGGKGMATAAGMMLAIIPVPVAVAGAVYLTVLSVTHYVALGSIGAAVSLPVVLIAGKFIGGAGYKPEIYVISLLLAVLILWTHRINIRRLRRGEEKKTYFFKKPG
ncbi:MAG: glycerol-3-phosphate 1-O-acyltransferase PlsY [Nitrospinota bacterium]